MSLTVAKQDCCIYRKASLSEDGGWSLAASSGAATLGYGMGVRCSSIVSACIKHWLHLRGGGQAHLAIDSASCISWWIHCGTVSGRRREGGDSGLPRPLLTLVSSGYRRQPYCSHGGWAVGGTRTNEHNFQK